LFPGQDIPGFIPDLPVIVNMPASLTPQFLNEARKFTDPTCVQLLEYKSGSPDMKKFFWSNVFNAAARKPNTASTDLDWSVMNVIVVPNSVSRERVSTKDLLLNRSCGGIEPHGGLQARSREREEAPPMRDIPAHGDQGEARGLPRQHLWAKVLAQR
jgi:hypothetical protein